MTNIFSVFIDSFATAQRAASRYERLSRMSDAQLARHGITRQDIARVAMADATR